MASETLAAVRQYRELGFNIIPVLYRDKRPAISDWSRQNLTDKEINKHFGNGKKNVGVVLGEMSGGLFDIDCDCREARVAASKLLPQTATFGRESNPRSHFLYYVLASPPDSCQFKDVDGSVLVEIRGDNRQTVIPPSCHPSGEAVEWFTDLGEIAEVERGRELVKLVSKVAAVSLISRNYPATGSRNDLALSLAGAFVNHGIDPDEAEYLIKLTAKLARDEEWRTRGNCIEHTLERIAKKEPAYGIPKLKEIIGEAVTSKVCDWMGLDDDAPSLGDKAVCLYSDLTNAEYFVREYGQDLRFNVHTRLWQCWNGKRWEADLVDRTKQLVIKSIRSMYSLLERIGDAKDRKELIKHIQESEARPRIEAMQKLAESFEGVPVRESDLNVNDMLLNVVNCTLDLESGRSREHLKGDLITKLSPVQYDAKAECPRWEKFLREVFQQNEELIGFVQRSCGYWLSGDTSEESMWILYGKAQSGKSKFLSIVSYILGDYAGTAAMSTFTEKREMNTYDLATLSNVRFVMATEASDSDAFNEPLLKQLTGRDMIKCRPIYGRPTEYMPKFKIAIATNELPRMKSQGYDMQRRLKIVPFRQRFYEPDEGMKPIKDPHILQKLIAEAPGILNWMLEGCLEWQRHGLMIPACVKAETSSVFEEQDTLGEFLAVCCILDSEATTRISDLWNTYRDWIMHAGIDSRTAIKQPQGLTRNLTRRDGIERVKTSTGERALMGIGLKPFPFDE